VREIKSDNVVTKEEVGPGGEALESVKGDLPIPISEYHFLLALAANGGKGENLRLTRINLKIDRKAAVQQKIINVPDLGSIHAPVFCPRYQVPDFAK
jgi:hypothetical protein